MYRHLKILLITFWNHDILECVICVIRLEIICRVKYPLSLLKCVTCLVFGSLFHNKAEFSVPESILPTCPNHLNHPCLKVNNFQLPLLIFKRTALINKSLINISFAFEKTIIRCYIIDFTTITIYTCIYIYIAKYSLLLKFRTKNCSQLTCLE